MVHDSPPTVPAQPGMWGWDKPAPRIQSGQQIRALTDVIRNLYDGVVPLPTQVKLPLKKHIREIQRLSGLKTLLYERRALLLALGSRLLPFVRLALRALEL